MIRACASPVLLDEFGVCGTRSKNEKTHKDCELRQVLDQTTELACVTRRLTRGPKNKHCLKRNNGVVNCISRAAHRSENPFPCEKGGEQAQRRGGSWDGGNKAGSTGFYVTRYNERLQVSICARI